MARYKVRWTREVEVEAASAAHAVKEVAEKCVKDLEDHLWDDVFGQGSAVVVLGRSQHGHWEVAGRGVPRLRRWGKKPAGSVEESR